jgi:hypothetical protein
MPTMIEPIIVKTTPANYIAVGIIPAINVCKNNGINDFKLSID